VEISSKGPKCDLEQIAKDFHNELIDQELRERIRNETHHLQEMIVREAFAPLEG
jgi:His-Xaa-Ser system protein HxsD